MSPIAFWAWVVFVVVAAAAVAPFYILARRLR